MARELLRGNYHLALLDINLPDGNGLDLCTEIKERNPETYTSQDCLDSLAEMNCDLAWYVCIDENQTETADT